MASGMPSSLRTDLADVVTLPVHDKIRRHGPGTLHEELYRRRVDPLTKAEWRHRADLLALDRQRLAAGGEQGNPRTLGHDSADKCGGFVDQVLAVVEHKQEPAAAEPLHDTLFNRLALLLSYAKTAATA